MISFSKIMREVLTERMSFRDLLSVSDPARIDRGKHDVRTKSLRVVTMDGNEAWTFSYKSSPSTTGTRWHGYIRFLKETIGSKENALDIDCMADCSCPDYRYRFAYRNAEQGAGQTGAGTLNQNNGQPPKTINTDLGPGLCKHLSSLTEYLKTQIDPVAPEDPNEVPKKSKETPTPIKPTKPSISSTPSKAGLAPEQPDTYSDSRTGDLMESDNGVYDKIDKFVKSNPEFEVNYEN